jgi:lipopolysaccharide biosynthesis regulator YciM
LVAQTYAETAIQLRQEPQARRVLEELQAQHPSVDQLRALNLLEDEGARRRQRLAQVLEQQPLLSNAQALMHEAHLDGQALTQAEEQAVFHAIREAARPLQRYGCAACGFKAQQHFWQCPGCLSWASLGWWTPGVACMCTGRWLKTALSRTGAPSRRG